MRPKNEDCSPQKVVLPKRKYLSINVYIICSVREEYALWEEEKKKSLRRFNNAF